MKADRPNFSWIYKAARELKKEKIDLLISPSLFMFGVFFKPTIQIIHDLAPIHYPNFWSKKAGLMYKYQLALCTRRVHKFAAISEFTKKDLIKLHTTVKNKTFSIGCGLHEWAYSELSKGHNTYGKIILPEEYILSVSTLQPRKNYINMIRGFRLFIKDNPNCKYVIVGKKGWYYEDIFTEVEKLHLEDKVIFTDYVDEEDIASIYDSAKFVMYCSIWEGFGLPAIEALSRGKSVVLSNLEVLKEAAGDLGIYVDPFDPADICDGMYKAAEKHISESEISQIKDEYRWDRVAERLVKMYDMPV